LTPPWLQNVVAVCTVAYVLVALAVLWRYREHDRRGRARDEQFERARREQLDAQFREQTQQLELRRHVFSLGKGNAKNSWLN
jgi:Flp pilus assembly protein TadB